MGKWPHLFLFSYFLVIMQPLDPLAYLLFIPGFFVPLNFNAKLRPLYLWLGWSFFSALLSPSYPSSLLDFGQESIIACAGFAAGLYGRQEPRWLTVLQVTALIMIGMILIQAVAAPPYPPGWVAPAERISVPFRVSGFWNNPNLTGLFLAFLIPLFLAGAAKGKAASNRRRISFMVLLVLTGMALVFTYSRTAWVAALVSLFLSGGPWEKEKLRRLLLIVLILVGLFPSIGDRIGRNPLESGTVRYRFRIWQETWGLVQKYPLTGGGDQELRATLRPLRAEHAHNHYLQLMAEKGLPAFLLFVWLVYQVLKASRHYGAAGEKSRLQRGVQAAFGGQLVAGLAESIWVIPLGSFLFWFAFATATAVRKPAVAEKPSPLKGSGKNRER